MRESEIYLLDKLRAISRLAAIVGILASISFIPLGGMPIEHQIILALAALTVGIPHGAVDHVITVPNFAFVKMSLFILGYLLVTGLVIWGILNANLLGFQLVVLMSAIHFGLGDAAFVSERENRKDNPEPFPKLPFIIAAGFTPVLIPLVGSQSTEALTAVNPVLVNWAGSQTNFILYPMVLITLGAIVLMLVRQRPQEAIELALLLTLALVATPLVAFAFYFGLWHALRHTGRISLELPASQQALQQAKSWKAFSTAVFHGLPALVIVIGFTLFLGFSRGFNISEELTWYLLVVIWALTVPHMALTLRLDLNALKTKVSI